MPGEFWPGGPVADATGESAGKVWPIVRRRTLAERLGVPVPLNVENRGARLLIHIPLFSSHIR